MSASLDSHRRADHFSVEHHCDIRSKKKIGPFVHKEADAPQRKKKIVSFVSFDTDDIFNKKRSQHVSVL